MAPVSGKAHHPMGNGEQREREVGEMTGTWGVELVLLARNQLH